MDGPDHTFWYLTRALGFVAFVLLSASVALGLVMTSGWPARLRRNVVYDIHRFVALLTLILTVLHAFIVLPDGFIGFSVAELLIPFASPYEPAFMALGTLSLYLMAIVIATFYLRPFVPYSAWRAIHYGTSVVYLLALVHGIGAGTDSDVAWAWIVYWVSGLTVVMLLAIRVVSVLRPPVTKSPESPGREASRPAIASPARPSALAAPSSNTTDHTMPS
ncbi:MAG TPA: ferric reductase-like transmembrane domain-containing protein [Dehalococcoidia bacterium]|nr:ferric reductase-like transmembrane domain-containing protein [Dehalococcoidia bacterium]